MKKIILGLMVAAVIAMVAAPVMAATQWNFGASMRYSTMWTEQGGAKADRVGGDFEGGGRSVSSDAKLDWGLNANTQIQIGMKSESLEGYAELGYNFDGGSVWTREFWGKYKFNDMLAITIGQQHQLFNQFISNQVWGPDLNMNGIGTAFKPPTPKITLTYGNFNFALVQPYTDRSKGVADPLNPSNKAFPMVKDIDSYIPQLQASYQYFADTWRVKVAGAYQYTSLNKMEFSPTDTKDKNINSWLIGLDGDINFGPLYLAAGFAAGQNWSDAGWNDESGTVSSVYTGDYLQRSFGVNYYMDGASVKWGNTNSIMASLVAAYRLTESLRFELGGGYRYDDNKAFDKSSNIWNIYLQAAYTVAPGFTIIPEIGYIDLGKTVGTHNGRGGNLGAAGIKSQDAGYIWYAGAKWQMDF